MSKTQLRKNGSSKNKSSQNNSQHNNQHGGSSEGQNEVPQISQATLEQAGKIAQTFLNNMAQNNGQKGGSAGADGTSATQHSAATTAQAEGLQNAMMEGAVAGANAGAVAAAEGYSSLNGSPLVGGRGSKRYRRGSKRRGRGRKTQSQSNSQSNSHSHSHSQKGGMVPGLMTAVETALVPLGLYLSQKALQSRRSGSSSLGNSFNFRRSSRRSRRRK